MICLDDMGYKHGDYRFVPLFEEFIAMKQEGQKVSYAVAVLADRYAVSERKVYDIIARFSRNCNLCAV